MRNFAPLSNGVAEGQQALDQAVGVNLDHGTKTTESSVLLVVIADRTASVAPGLGKDLEVRANQLRADQSQATDRDRRVVQESASSVLGGQKRDQALQEGLDPRTHTLSVLKGNLSGSPGSVIAHGNVLRVGLDLADKLVHESIQVWLNVQETADGQVTQKGVGGLADLGGRVSETDAKDLEDAGLTCGNQALDTGVQSLGQSTEEIQCDNHEVLIGGGDILGVLAVHLSLQQVAVHNLDAAVKDWGSKRQESLTQGGGDRGQAL